MMDSLPTASAEMVLPNPAELREGAALKWGKCGLSKRKRSGCSSGRRSRGEWSGCYECTEWCFLTANNNESCKQADALKGIFCNFKICGAKSID
jgi:hypothetical protein